MKLWGIGHWIVPDRPPEMGCHCEECSRGRYLERLGYRFEPDNSKNLPTEGDTRC